MNLVDGRQLKAARAILGLTVQDVARGAQVNRNTVWRVEGIEALPDRASSAHRIGQFMEGQGVAFDVINGNPSVRFAPVAALSERTDA